jgi:hypothetical protein
MVMSSNLRITINEPQTARHAQMNHHSASARHQQQIFTSSINCLDNLSSERLAKVCGNRPA